MEYYGCGWKITLSLFNVRHRHQRAEAALYVGWGGGFDLIYPYLISFGEMDFGCDPSAPRRFLVPGSAEGAAAALW